ncbi:MAG: porin family protein [Muribaculaceae bacterium]|nr:porin family protein [Muribaculaceae bacterium]MDE6810681.1 porin family protein [Muribaculaceae bacterium]
MRFNLLNRLFPVIIIFIVSLSTARADDFRKGEKTIGVEVGYNSFNESAVTGITFSYRFNRLLRIAPNVQYVFRNNQTDAFIFNCDFHVPFKIKTSRVELFPLAGVCYASWNHHGLDGIRTISDDVSSRDSQFGINVGGGIGFKCSGNLRLFAEGRYSFVRDYNNTSILAGIAYSF